jgi:hypothetical protein
VGELDKARFEVIRPDIQRDMKNILKRILEDTPLYHPLRNWLRRTREAKELRVWQKNGRPVPPPHIVKEKALKAYGCEYKLGVLVETGTYYGDMVEAMKHDFERIYSIELDHHLYVKAKNRFRLAKHIKIIHGDSGRELGEIMKEIDQPCLFWLDGHYSGGKTNRGVTDTPVWAELNHILNSSKGGSVIIIDDARCFGKDPAYPSIEELQEFVQSRDRNAQVSVQNDSIRVILSENSHQGEPSRAEHE